jgi:hypothetical protein
MSASLVIRHLCRKEQKWWIEELGKQGFKASICHGWQEAVRLIEWYMSDEGNT